MDSRCPNDYRTIWPRHRDGAILTLLFFITFEGSMHYCSHVCISIDTIVQCRCTPRRRPIPSRPRQPFLRLPPPHMFILRRRVCRRPGHDRVLLTGRGRCPTQDLKDGWLCSPSSMASDKRTVDKAAADKARLRLTYPALSLASTPCALHTYIKPANVLLGGDGHAFLSDFGTVRAEGVDTSTVLYQSTRRNQLAETCFCNVQNDIRNSYR